MFILLNCSPQDEAAHQDVSLYSSQPQLAPRWWGGGCRRRPGAARGRQGRRLQAGAARPAEPAQPENDSFDSESFTSASNILKISTKIMTQGVIYLTENRPSFDLVHFSCPHLQRSIFIRSRVVFFIFAAQDGVLNTLRALNWVSNTLRAALRVTESAPDLPPPPKGPWSMKPVLWFSLLCLTFQSSLLLHGIIFSFQYYHHHHHQDCLY